MAIYSNNASICSGAKGGSAVASSAYQSADKLKDSQEGLIKSYGRKERVVAKGITKPDNAPEWCLDRECLWNEVQKVEGVNGQYARKHHLALPRELSLEQQEQLVKAYCSAFSEQGMVCDWAIHHDKDNHNPHAHIMTTMRPFKKDGSWGQKSKNVAVKDKNGKPVIEGTYANGRKKYKHKCVKMTNWDSKKTLAKWREDWEKLTNDALEKAGSDARVSAKSYKDQGKDYLVPTEHLGPAVSALEKKGIKTDRGNYNRAVKKYNDEVLKYISDTNDLEKNIINSEVVYYGESRNELNAVIAKNVRESENGHDGGISLLNNSRFVNLQNLSESGLDTERTVQNGTGTGDNQSYLSQFAWCYTANGITQSDERKADERNERAGDNQRLQSVSADFDSKLNINQSEKVYKNWETAVAENPVIKNQQIIVANTIFNKALAMKNYKIPQKHINRKMIDATLKVTPIKVKDNIAIPSFTIPTLPTIFKAMFNEYKMPNHAIAIQFAELSSAIKSAELSKDYDRVFALINQMKEVAENAR